MSDTQNSSFCHNCGDHVDDNTIYCQSCADGEAEVDVDDEQTWADVKETASGKLASGVHTTLIVVAVLLFGMTTIALVNKYAFGAEGARTTLLIVACMFIPVTIFTLKKTWTAYRLRVEAGAS